MIPLFVNGDREKEEIHEAVKNNRNDDDIVCGYAEWLR